MKRRKYRLNIRRFSIFLFVLTSVIVLIVLAAGNRSGMASNDMADPNAMDMGGQTQDTDRADESTLVLLDAGHGGFDPGTIGVAGTHEDVLNLQITQRLKSMLVQNGIRVIMTREDENALGPTKDDDMEARSRMIGQSGADLVVSIHMNWYWDAEISGPTVLFCPGSEQGREFAETVQDSMNTALGTDQIARSEDFFVLRSGDQPSIMVECGYISNAEEESRLKQEDYQQRVAEAICEGIQNFLEESGTDA